MEKLEKIVGFLDRYLEIESIKDSSWNGLQYQGKPDVKRVLFTCYIHDILSELEMGINETVFLFMAS